MQSNNAGGRSSERRATPSPLTITQTTPTSDRDRDRDRQSRSSATPPSPFSDRGYSQSPRYSFGSFGFDSKSRDKDANFKTELCRHYSESFSCRFGEQCRYAHGEGELRSQTMEQMEKCGRIPSRNNIRKLICATWIATGACPYEAKKKCSYKHDPRIQGAFPATLNATKDVHQRPKDEKDLFFWPEDEVTVTESSGNFGYGSRLPIAVPINSEYTSPSDCLEDPKNYLDYSVGRIWASFVGAVKAASDLPLDVEDRPPEPLPIFAGLRKGEGISNAKKSTTPDRVLWQPPSEHTSPDLVSPDHHHARSNLYTNSNEEPATYQSPYLPSCLRHSPALSDDSPANQNYRQEVPGYLSQQLYDYRSPSPYQNAWFYGYSNQSQFATSLFHPSYDGSSFYGIIPNQWAAGGGHVEQKSSFEYYPSDSAESKEIENRPKIDQFSKWAALDTKK